MNSKIAPLLPVKRERSERAQRSKDDPNPPRAQKVRLKKESTLKSTGHSKKLKFSSIDDDPDTFSNTIHYQRNDMFRKVYFKRQEGNRFFVPLAGTYTPMIGTPKNLKTYYEPVYSDEEYSGGDNTYKKPNSKSKRKTYTFAFKMTVIKEAMRTTPFQAADKYNIGAGQVSAWMKRFMKNGPQDFMNKQKQKIKM